jgi:branched-chain amino acid transport system ATP-binding protein
MELRLEGIDAGYGTVTVLRSIDLVVPSGSVVALLGANGAGKTTLLRVAAGLLRPTAGEVRINGEPAGAAGADRRSAAGLCLLPEGRGIFTDLTVRENLRMFAGSERRRDAVEIAAAAFPRLGERMDQRAGTMSGGEQQMLAVCRALVTQPGIVMADELSVGLAPVVIDYIFEAVNSLRASGCSLLIVEQYVDRILEIADYVYVLHKGSIAFVGEPGQFADRDLFDEYLGRSA